MVPVRVHGVAILAPDDETPVMLLRETAGERRWLPISIGMPEANALVAAHQRVEHPRPDTIQLIGHVIGAFGRRVRRVEVTALHEGVFHADLVLDDGVRISARPSDAVALGLRAEAPIEVDEEVLAVAAVELELSDEPNREPDVEREIETFRARLDEATPEDFEDRPPE
ncbi:bifunctional nuclease family protein [Amycolatopsis arida]|uniref:bifunctional nuclease family protein n=1 Tax=Amycolatopsis arida TaxID=587909 RepID=UPI000B84318C|nr:bifunctional nuclease family protein [Amycolatopsis arida]